LAGAAQQRQDRLIAPRYGGRNQAFNEERIESSRKASGHAAAKLSPPLAHGLIATGESVGHRLIVGCRHGVRVLAPSAVTAVIVVSYPKGEVRR
jgi:hypothetical protein